MVHYYNGAYEPHRIYCVCSFDQGLYKNSDWLWINVLVLLLGQMANVELLVTLYYMYDVDPHTWSFVSPQPWSFILANDVILKKKWIDKIL